LLAIITGEYDPMGAGLVDKSIPSEDNLSDIMFFTNTMGPLLRISYKCSEAALTYTGTMRTVSVASSAQIMQDISFISQVCKVFLNETPKETTEPEI
jgi:hypothetical protein